MASENNTRKGPGIESAPGVHDDDDDDDDDDETVLLHPFRTEALELGNYNPPTTLTETLSLS